MRRRFSIAFPGLVSRIAAPVGAVLAAFLLAACLIGGGGTEAEDGGGTENDADALLVLGDYAGAMTAFEARIAADSADSRAYYGYMKAALKFHGIDSATLANEFRATFADDASSFDSGFMAHPDTVLTARFQGLVQVNRVLDAFIDRDTLNLLDGKLDREDISPEFAVYRFAYVILRFNDVPPYGVFGAEERTFRSLLNEDGTFGDLSGLADSLRADSTLNGELYQKILELQNGLGGLDSLLAAIGADST